MPIYKYALFLVSRREKPFFSLLYPFISHPNSYIWNKTVMKGMTAAMHVAIAAGVAPESASTLVAVSLTGPSAIGGELKGEPPGASATGPGAGAGAGEEPSDGAGASSGGGAGGVASDPSGPGAGAGDGGDGGGGGGEGGTGGIVTTPPTPTASRGVLI